MTTTPDIRDLVKRLRDNHHTELGDVCDDAADLITALRERVAELDDLVTEVPTIMRRAERAEAKLEDARAAIRALAATLDEKGRELTAEEQQTLGGALRRSVKIVDPGALDEKEG